MSLELARRWSGCQALRTSYIASRRRPVKPIAIACATKGYQSAHIWAASKQNHHESSLMDRIIKQLSLDLARQLRGNIVERDIPRSCRC